MNTLKPLLVVAVLALIGYGVYVRINGPQDDAPMGFGDVHGDFQGSGPRVQLGDHGPPSGSPSGLANLAPAPGSSGAPGWSSSAVENTHTASPGGSGLAPRLGDPAPFPPMGSAAGLGGASAPRAVDVEPGSPFGPPAGSPPGGNLGGQLQNNANPFADAPRDLAPLVSDPRGSEPRAIDPRAAELGGGAVAATYDSRSADRMMPNFEGGSSGAFAAAWDAAQRELASGQLASALQQLTVWYGDPRLSPTEHQQLVKLLGDVSGTVVYSTEHRLEPAYDVMPGEKLENIAQRYNVPWQLLAKINGIGDPANLRPGTRLKVVRGPFNGVISLEKRELTLFVNGSYAGRYRIGLGSDLPPREGTFLVSDKVLNPPYQNRQQQFGPDDPQNPLGKRYINLGGSVGIHGTNRDDNLGRADLPGSISLSRDDIDHVYDILSVGSRVTIRR